VDQDQRPALPELAVGETRAITPAEIAEGDVSHIAGSFTAIRAGKQGST
jgi:hypothetical protein